MWQRGSVVWERDSKGLLASDREGCSAGGKREEGKQGLQKWAMESALFAQEGSDINPQQQLLHPEAPKA